MTRVAPLHFTLPLLLLAGIATPAVAAPPETSRATPGWIRAEFGRADRNGDRVLSRGEVTAAVNRNYGRLSTGRSRIMTNMWFNRLDANRSNGIGLDEAQAFGREFWTRFDRNRDGRIGPRERGDATVFLRNPAR